MKKERELLISFYLMEIANLKKIVTDTLKNIIKFLINDLCFNIYI